MANKVPFIRFYLNERIRKHLGINLKNKKIYIFKVKNKTYLSTDTIPRHTQIDYLTVKCGSYRWYINIPITYLEYEPSGVKLLNSVGKVLELIETAK